MLIYEEHIPVATLKFFITNGKAVGAPADDVAGSGGRAGASAEELNELMRRRLVFEFQPTTTCTYLKYTLYMPC